MRNRRGGTQQYEKVFPRNGGIQGGGGTREEECSFPEGDRRAIWGTSLKSLLAAWPPPREAIEPTFKPGSIEKPILRCRQPQKLSDLPIFSGYSRILEI